MSDDDSWSLSLSRLLCATMWLWRPIRDSQRRPHSSHVHATLSSGGLSVAKCLRSLLALVLTSSKKLTPSPHNRHKLGLFTARASSCVVSIHQLFMFAFSWSLYLFFGTTPPPPLGKLTIKHSFKQSMVIQSNNMVGPPELPLQQHRLHTGDVGRL